MYFKPPTIHQLMIINKASHYLHKHNLPTNYQLAFSSDDYKLSKEGYYGIAAISHHDRQIVICNAGTKFDFSKPGEIYNDLCSDWQIIHGFIPNQYKYALAFTDYCISNLPEDYDISITGYSLGAVLADLTTYCLAEKYPYKLKNITFENPGSSYLIKNRLLEEDDDINNHKTSFKVYNSASPNLINSFGKNIVEPTHLCLDKSKFKDKFSNVKFINLWFEDHLFRNFLDGAFDENGNILPCERYQNNNDYE